MELSILINKFNVKGRLVSLQPFGNGNINDTFLAIYRNTFTETQVILQRVNRNVFPKPEIIMANMHEITKHCHEKLEADAKSGTDDRVWQMPRIIKTKDAKDYVTDENGDVWRVITRIMSAHAFDVAQGPEHAMECGSALGHFHYLISDLDPTTVKDPLPGFHITSDYLAKYDATLKTKQAKALLGRFVLSGFFLFRRAERVDPDPADISFLPVCFTALFFHALFLPNPTMPLCSPI